MNNKNQLIINGNKAVETMALKIANESPELKDLTSEQLEQIAKIVITQNLTNELNNKAKIAGVSSFYSYLERRYSVIKNPIRGTKARPAKKPVKDIEVPDEVELFTILNSMPELEKMAIYIMAYRGLRLGALKELKIWGNKYQSYSKGKSIYGEFPIEVIANIKNSDLFNKSPFQALTTNALKLRIYRQTLKLFNEGKIQSAYSAHDFRHYFAVSEYQKDKDIYRVSKLLDHTNISITEGYLRSLKVA